MRRRHQLRPDTFPFLAVLLCAMGSLILVLMELDRRARSQAHARAEQVWRENEREKAELLARLQAEREAEQQAELERLQQAREARLANHRTQQRQLQKKAQTVQAEHAQVQDQLDALLRSLQSERTAQALVEQRQGKQSKQTEQALQALAAREKQVTQDEKKLETSRVSSDRLTRDLLLLEESLARLKAQRQRQGKTWSLVPYVGKRGMNRRPMYVECDADGFLFHPDRKRLSSREATPQSLADEVSRRMREYTEKRPAGDSTPEPYWMLLVRPQGITAYYRFLQAIRPLEAAYGYEFIDPGWDLDFPDAATLPPPVEVAVPLPSPSARETLSPFPAPAGGSASGPRGAEAARIAIGPPHQQASRPVPASGSAGPPTAEILLPRRSGPPGVEGHPLARQQGGPPQQQGGAPRVPQDGGSPPARAGSASSAGMPAGQVGAREPGPASTSDPAPEGGRGRAGPGIGSAGASGPRFPSRHSTPEWVILVECRPDGVMVSPSRWTFALADLAAGQGADTQLVRTVRELIERRRSAERPGEEPVKIVIRFLVHKDALRTFHLTYPLLDVFDVEKRAVLSGE